MADVFISYSRDDYLFVERFVRILQSSGATTWFDRDNLLPGQKWESVIDDEIGKATVFLPLISASASKRRGYFQSEQVTALRAAMRVPSDQIFLMPVLLGEVEIPREIRQYHAENLCEPDAFEKVFAALSAGIGRRLAIFDKDAKDLRDILVAHLGIEARFTEDFVEAFKSPDIAITDSVNLLERIANARDPSRLEKLLSLRALPHLAMAEHKALDLAIDHVQTRKRVDQLFEQAVVPEKMRIVEMAGDISRLVNQQLATNKYVRYISRRDSAPYEAAQKKLLELLVQGFQ